MFMTKIYHFENFFQVNDAAFMVILSIFLFYIL